MDQDLFSLVNDISKFSAAMTEAGISGERSWTRPYLHAIFVAYDRAKEDPKAVIPTVLMAAIEAARSALGECAEPASPYADRRTEQRRSDLELSCYGHQIKPGE